MTNWYTADQHYGHDNIRKYANRPFYSCHEMNCVITKKWNKRVQEDDTIYVIGDFCFGNPLTYIKRLNGTKILIKGNHDRNRTMKAFDFSYLCKPIQIGKYNCIMNHRPIHPEGTPDPYRDHGKVPEPWKYDFFISGHIHQHRLWTGYSINVGVDVTDFYPISEELVLKLLTQREEELGGTNKTNHGRI